MTEERLSTNAEATLERLTGGLALLVDGAGDSALYAAVEDALQSLSGFRLLTILRITPCGRGLERLHSSNTAIYPDRGVKAVDGDPWLEHLLRITGPELSPDAGAVRRNFFDAAAIFGLDCQSVLNAPIRFHGRNLGTLNLLHREHWYQPADVKVCQLFANVIGAAWAAARNPPMPATHRQ